MIRPLEENQKYVGGGGCNNVVLEKNIYEGGRERRGEKEVLTYSSLSERSVQLYQCQVYHL